MINEVVKQTLIIAHKEDVTALVRALRREGLSPAVVRKNYTPDESTYSPTIKCMMTHMEAWRSCADNDGISVIVEADFVPVVGFGKSFLPYDIRIADKCFGYLYSCGPQLWDIDELGFARGHAGGLVAYSLTVPIAKQLLVYGNKVLSDTNLKDYSLWDAGLGYYLKARGIQSYLTFRMLGEHGGIPNAEHRSSGLSRTHRADTLANRLHFLPKYTNSSKLRLFTTRLYARLYGLGRLVLLKYLAFQDISRANNKRQLLKFAILRHLY